MFAAGLVALTCGTASLARWYSFSIIADMRAADLVDWTLQSTLAINNQGVVSYDLTRSIGIELPGATNLCPGDVDATKGSRFSTHSGAFPAAPRESA